MHKFVLQPSQPHFVSLGVVQISASKCTLMFNHLFMIITSFVVDLHPTAYRAVLCAQIRVAQRSSSVSQQVFCEVSQPGLVRSCCDLMTYLLATATACCVSLVVCMACVWLSSSSRLP